MIIVDVHEVLDLAADLAAAGTKIVPEAKAATKLAGDELLAAMKRDAPVLTGQLRGDIALHSDGMEYVAGSTVRQGFFQEFGTSRHPPQPWAFHNGDRAGDRLGIALVKVADPL